MTNEEVIQWYPTSELRWYSPDPRWVPEHLERLFIGVDSEGVEWRAWHRVHVDAPLIRYSQVKEAP